MDLRVRIREEIADFLRKNYGWEGVNSEIELQETRKEFDGEFTFVVFPYLRIAKAKPEVLAENIGNYLKESVDYITGFNVVKGFLNISISSTGWMNFLQDEIGADFTYEVKPEKILVEFCSPNTNKPLHLGHIRNILLGDSVSRILKAVGHEVINTQIINDRGIAISKSMLAWMHWGNGETPESTGIKGDHFVGNFYVLFDQKLSEEYKAWQNSEEGKSVFSDKGRDNEEAEEFYKGYKNDYFNEYSLLGKEARELLLRWEDGEKEAKDVWEMMNGWVMGGFEETFKRLDVSFDKNYFESDTYLLGREVVEEGEKKGIFTKREDGSIWVDLSDKGLDQKILLRADGTSLYTTQDIGTAQLRFDDYGMDRMIYVVGDEQEYHFQALFAILEKLGVSYRDGLYHLSYGMVDLPSGKMKSREGNVVDADDLVQEVIEIVIVNTRERGELGELSGEEYDETIRKIALGALKFFILQVNPRKRMMYDPEQSVDLQGHTGPYVQNAFVRIQSLLRKNLRKQENNSSNVDIELHEQEINLLSELHKSRDKVVQAAEEYNPSLVADQAYSIAKAFHRFYHDVPILRTESEDVKQFRINLCEVTARHLEYLFGLLNVGMPNRM